MSGPERRCSLFHPGFARLDGMHFRLTEGDRMPALIFELDGSQAVLPIPAVQRLFNIEAGSEDATTLNLVGSALRFVTCIKPGDVFPTEVISGEASWKPEPHHLGIAFNALQLKLLQWISADGEAASVTPEMLVAGDSRTKRLVNDAFHKAAAQLGFGNDAAAVTSLLNDLAEELAYIEAMRERLLLRVTRVLRGLVQMERKGRRLPQARRETLQQVVRLMKVGLSEITALFKVVDDQTGSINALLNDVSGQRSIIRPNRDWLYCMCIAWEHELERWKTLASDVPEDGEWFLMDSLYRFVAVRFMKPEEWRKFDTAMPGRQAKTIMVW